MLDGRRLFAAGDEAGEFACHYACVIGTYRFDGIRATRVMFREMANRALSERQGR